jgi:hypothetical protein
MSACECAACGRKFSCVSAFDQHQTMGDGSFGSVTCNAPEHRGLVIRDGRWRWPQTEAGRLRLLRAMEMS